MFREALRDFIEPVNLGEEDEYSIGLRGFDSLPYPQKLAVLAVVSRALLCRDVPAPRLTAVAESAAAAVFLHLKNEVQVDLDMASDEASNEAAPWRTHWRSRIAEAARYLESSDVPGVSCEDFEEWDACVEALMDCIFWDRDFEGMDTEDMDPGAGQALKKLVGISDDYFVGIAPDPKPEQVDSIKQQLRAICEEGGVS